MGTGSAIRSVLKIWNPVPESWNGAFQKAGTVVFQKAGTVNGTSVPESWNRVENDLTVPESWNRSSNQWAGGRFFKEERKGMSQRDEEDDACTEITRTLERLCAKYGFETVLAIFSNRISYRANTFYDGVYETSAGMQSAHGIPHGGRPVQQMAFRVGGLYEPNAPCLCCQPIMDGGSKAGCVPRGR